MQGEEAVMECSPRAQALLSKPRIWCTALPLLTFAMKCARPGVSAQAVMGEEANMVRIPCWGRDEPEGDPALALLADALLSTLERLGPAADLRAHTRGVQAAVAAAWAAWAAAQRPPPLGLGSLGFVSTAAAHGGLAGLPQSTAGAPVLGRGAAAAVASAVAEALSLEKRAGEAQEEPCVVDDRMVKPVMAHAATVEDTAAEPIVLEATVTEPPVLKP